MDPFDFVGYVVMFLLGLGVLGVYQYNKSREKILPLSIQRYPNLILEVFIKKQHAKTKNLVIKVSPKKEVEISRMYIELIGKKREMKKIGFAETVLEDKETTTTFPDKPVEIVIPLEEFKSYLITKEIPFRTFRFVVDALPNNKYKTHELAFNRNWNIFKPDSGKYN